MESIENITDLVELGFDETNEYGSGLTAISVVKRPAIKAGFIAFNHDLKIEFKEDKERRMLYGPALIPDMPIFRRDFDEKTKKSKEYYAYMTAETIEKLAHSYLKNGRQGNTTIEHKVAVKGCYLVEQWIIEDPKNDKANAMGLEYPKGTMMIGMKVDNDTVWNDFVKNGTVTGFSIEALLPSREKKLKYENRRIEAAVKAIFNVKEKKK